ncbi:MAG: hypothetical protein H6817_00265 [Phycisphaerales bacterium]|nr:hypothetical protein [Phycisphaerales bacterium]
MMVGVTLLATPTWAVTAIDVPNASFENPQTFFVWPDADDWDETGPVGEDPLLPGVVDTIDTGVFFNSPVDEGGQPSPFYITNADGFQLAFISADDASTIAFFQELETPYEVGGTYTVELLVGEGYFFPPLSYNPNDPPPPNPPPAVLELSLYYADTNGAQIVIADRIISADEMPGPPNEGTLLLNVGTTGEAIASLDAWAGRPIGVLVRPVLGLSGNWNIDLARVSVSCDIGIPGDADFDGDVDLADHDAFVRCVTGPNGSSRPAECAPCEYERLDADSDGDVDLRDYAAITQEL